MQHARFDIVGPFNSAMHASEGTGLPLVANGRFAADVIHFEPGRGVARHTHPGSHILLCTHGRGRVECEGETADLSPGVCYLIPGGAAHAVYASPDSSLTLVSVADDHRPVDSAERLDPCP